MRLRIRGEEIHAAFVYTLAATIIFLFIFDVNEAYLDPLVADGSFIYGILVKTLIVVVSVYIWSVVVGNAYNLGASS
jgi:hypothetical protein